MNERRKFTREEKLRIVQEAAASGVKVTLEKYGVYPATYYGWKKKLDEMGEGAAPRHDPGASEGDPAAGEGEPAPETALGRAAVGGQAQGRAAAKEVPLGQRKELIGQFMPQGIKRDRALHIAGMTRHQYYHRPKSGNAGRPVSDRTSKRMADGTTEPMPDAQVVEDISALKADPATDCGYQKTARLLMLMGW